MEVALGVGGVEGRREGEAEEEVEEGGEGACEAEGGV